MDADKIESIHIGAAPSTPTVLTAVEATDALPAPPPSDGGDHYDHGPAPSGGRGIAIPVLYGALALLHVSHHMREMAVAAIYVALAWAHIRDDD